MAATLHYGKVLKNPCLRLGTRRGVVRCIELNLGPPLRISNIPEHEFELRYGAGHPARFGLALVAAYARDLGATQEAIAELGKLTPLRKGEIPMVELLVEKAPVRAPKRHRQARA